MRLIPATALVFAIYALLVAAVHLWPPTLWLAFPVQGIESLLAWQLPTLRLDSGPWTLTVGHVFVIAGVFSLLVGMIRATHSSESAIAERLFSMLAVLLGVILFLRVPGFHTPEFTQLMAIGLVDAAAGFYVIVKAARREMAFKT